MSSQETLPYIGSKISLISNSEIRYEGYLVAINTEESTASLKNVVSFGSEGRRHPDIPPSPETFDSIVFKGQDIKELTVCEPDIVPLQTEDNIEPTISDVNNNGNIKGNTNDEIPSFDMQNIDNSNLNENQQNFYNANHPTSPSLNKKKGKPMISQANNATNTGSLLNQPVSTSQILSSAALLSPEVNIGLSNNDRDFPLYPLAASNNNSFDNNMLLRQQANNNKALSINNSNTGNGLLSYNNLTGNMNNDSILDTFGGPLSYNSHNLNLSSLNNISMDTYNRLNKLNNASNLNQNNSINKNSNNIMNSGTNNNNFNNMNENSQGHRSSLHHTNQGSYHDHQLSNNNNFNNNNENINLSSAGGYFGMNRNSQYNNNYKYKNYHNSHHYNNNNYGGYNRRIVGELSSQLNPVLKSKLSVEFDFASSNAKFSKTDLFSNNTGADNNDEETDVNNKSSNNKENVAEKTVEGEEEKKENVENDLKENMSKISSKDVSTSEIDTKVSNNNNNNSSNSNNINSNNSNSNNNEGKSKINEGDTKTTKSSNNNNNDSKNNENSNNVHIGGYNKRSSFFDNISCESLDKREGREERVDREKQRALDLDTFGDSASGFKGPKLPFRRRNNNMYGHHHHHYGHRKYHQSGYNYHINNYHNNNNNYHHHSNQHNNMNNNTRKNMNMNSSTHNMHDNNNNNASNNVPYHTHMGYSKKNNAYDYLMYNRNRGGAHLNFQPIRY